ncbi:MAG: hypothetical protein KFKLKKLM_00945 [Flavobacteriales bacterium]|nr:hypothetical protein [Flavobacteriales bacterium]
MVEANTVFMEVLLELGGKIMEDILVHYKEQTILVYLVLLMLILHQILTLMVYTQQHKEMGQAQPMVFTHKMLQQ